MERFCASNSRSRCLSHGFAEPLPKSISRRGVERTSPARRGRKGCPVFAKSVQVDDEKATVSAAPPQRKGLPASARDLLSEMLTSLTGREKDKDMFFTDDRTLLQANEVQELWMLSMNQYCDASRIAKALDNSFRIEAAFARIPGSQNKWKLVGLARTISDGIFAALLTDLCVHPQFRRRGIGSKLLLRLEQSTRKSSACTLGAFARPREFMFMWNCGFRYNRRYTVMQYVGKDDASKKRISEFGH
ncbi:hypothetical protein BSKO_12840 [Bryopsis sp. KO-2023]|nr:hypothetical protein BSKO_12840 [Bryopsis sp. KO-2023]